jgi:hypothetical protein
VYTLFLAYQAYSQNESAAGITALKDILPEFFSSLPLKKGLLLLI